MKAIARLLAAVLVSALSAWAQGVIKDEIARDSNGAPLLNKTVRVCAATAAVGPPCNPTAPIYSDIALATRIANSQVTTSSTDGRYTFYAAPGRYLIQVLDVATQVQLYRDVVLGNDPASNTVVGGPRPPLHMPAGPLAAFARTQGFSLAVLPHR